MVSVMNLASPLHASLNENTINRLIGICLDGPKFLTEEQLEKIIDKYKGQCSMQNFYVTFFDVIFY